MKRNVNRKGLKEGKYFLLTVLICRGQVIYRVFSDLNLWLTRDRPLLAGNGDRHRFRAGNQRIDVNSGQLSAPDTASIQANNVIRIVITKRGPVTK